MILKKVNYPFQVVLPTSANPSEASTGWWNPTCSIMWLVGACDRTTLIKQFL
jgi:hypothetical protein